MLQALGIGTLARRLAASRAVVISVLWPSGTQGPGDGTQAVEVLSTKGELKETFRPGDLQGQIVPPPLRPGTPARIRPLLTPPACIPTPCNVPGPQG